MAFTINSQSCANTIDVSIPCLCRSLGKNVDFDLIASLIMYLDEAQTSYIEIPYSWARSKDSMFWQSLTGRPRKVAKLFTTISCDIHEAIAASSGEIQAVLIDVSRSPLFIKTPHVDHGSYLMAAIVEIAQFLHKKGIKVFCTMGDSFARGIVSSFTEQLCAYSLISRYVDAVVISDYRGLADPLQVNEYVRLGRQVVYDRYRLDTQRNMQDKMSAPAGVIFRGSDSTRCAIANAYCSSMAGASKVVVSVFGLGLQIRDDGQDIISDTRGDGTDHKLYLRRLSERLEDTPLDCNLEERIAMLGRAEHVVAKMLTMALSMPIQDNLATAVAKHVTLEAGPITRCESGSSYTSDFESSNSEYSC